MDGRIRHVEALGLDKGIILKYILKKERENVNWSCMSQDKNQWRTVVNRVRELGSGNFWTSWLTVSIS
jgi:hypothetical protein